MHHPILKTLFARLRAFEAIERAAFALTTVEALMEPFERHRVRFAANDGYTILSKGECVAAMFACAPVDGSMSRFFRRDDRPFLQKLLESLVVQEMACHFGATTSTRGQVPVALEGLIVPEPPAGPQRTVEHVSLCLIRSDFPAELTDTDGLLPMALGPTRFITLDNRGEDRVPLYKPRWPAATSWQ